MYIYCPLKIAQHIAIIVKKVWGCMIAAGTGEPSFIEGNMDSNMYCDIPKQNMMPSLQKLV